MSAQNTNEVKRKEVFNLFDFKTLKQRKILASLMYSSKPHTAHCVNSQPEHKVPAKYLVGVFFNFATVWNKVLFH